MSADQRYVRGIFCGGTFCFEAQLLCQAAGITSWSNTPVAGNHVLADIRVSSEHTIVDMGDDEFTQGRPHPMIDPTLRDERVARDAADPTTAVVLSTWCSATARPTIPRPDCSRCSANARSNAEGRGRHLAVVAHVCGTDADPQAARRDRSPSSARPGAWSRRATPRPPAGPPTSPRSPAGSSDERGLRQRPQGRQRRAVELRRQPAPRRRPRHAARLAPPAGGDVATGLALASLVNDPVVEAANATAFGRYLAAQPVLVDVVLRPRGDRRARRRAPDPARRAADRLGRHVRPGAGRHRRRDRLRGLGRRRPTRRWRWRPRGDVAFAPCHDHHAVGPMAGIISPSMPVWVVENTTAGNRAYCNFNEGLGKVLRVRRQRSRGDRPAAVDGHRAVRGRAGRRRAVSTASSSSR